MLFPERLPRALILAAPLALLLAGRDAAGQDTVPGWVANQRPPVARIERDTIEKHGGSASGHFVATAPERGGGGHGGGGGGGPRVMPTRFTQLLNAQPYRNRRIRVSMWVRTRLPEKAAPNMPVSQAATFMRIDNEDATFVAYEGSSVSPMYGNMDWTRKFIVLEVPPDAFALAFGIGITGPGEVWVDDVLLEDQGEASGSWQKTPLVPPQRLQTMSPEQVEQGKAMVARRAASMKERPAEVTNGDFEAK